MESEASLNDLGVLPKIALDVITASAANSALPLIASIQPIEEQKGIIYFRKVISRTNRGNVTDGTVLRSGQDWRQNLPGILASEEVIGEVKATGDGSTTDFNFNLAYPPVRTRTVTIRLSDGTVKGIDDGAGNIIGVGVSGVVNYQTGAVSIHFDKAPAKGVEILADYDSNFEEFDRLPTIGDEFDSITIEAKPYALRSDISFFKNYAMSKRFGINVEELVARDLTVELDTTISSNAVKKACKCNGNYRMECCASNRCKLY
jgi:hypothetical protein